MNEAKKSLNAQVFNDGMAKFYKVMNVGLPGRTPKAYHELYMMMPFAYRIVGSLRYWEAQRLNVQLDKLIRISKVKGISVLDEVEIQGERYVIRQLQEITDVTPHVLDIALTTKGLKL